MTSGLVSIHATLLERASFLHGRLTRGHVAFYSTHDMLLEAPITGPVGHGMTEFEMVSQVVFSVRPSLQRYPTESASRADLEARRLPSLHDPCHPCHVVHESQVLPEMIFSIKNLLLAGGRVVRGEMLACRLVLPAEDAAGLARAGIDLDWAARTAEPSLNWHMEGLFMSRPVVLCPKCFRAKGALETTVGEKKRRFDSIAAMSSSSRPSGGAGRLSLVAGSRSMRTAGPAAKGWAVDDMRC